MTVDWMDSLLCLEHVYMIAVTWQPIYNDNYTKSSVALQSLSKCWCIIVFWHCIGIMLWFNWYLGLWKKCVIVFFWPLLNFLVLSEQVTWLTSLRSEAHVCLPARGAPWWVLLQHYPVVILSSLCAFSVLCVYLKFGRHPHPLGYLSAKFCFFRGLHCWASPWRKIAYSITHPAYLMPQEPKRLHFGITDNLEYLDNYVAVI